MVTPPHRSLAPIARDDSVLAIVQAASRSISVDVLRNDEDPDGDTQDDTLSSPDSGIGAGSTITIPLSPKPQTVIYTVTDRPDCPRRLCARARNRDHRPTLDTRALPIKGHGRRHQKSPSTTTF